MSDLEGLARDTHKFESRYLDSLVGPYPEERDTYRSRSPIHAVDRLSCALILFQGLEDRVVPPIQSESMADAARRKGLPVAYLTFAGEQHGFRKAETLVRCLEAELYFYGAVFGFEPGERLQPIAHRQPRSTVKCRAGPFGPALAEPDRSPISRAPARAITLHVGGGVAPPINRRSPRWLFTGDFSGCSTPRGRCAASAVSTRPKTPSHEPHVRGRARVGARHPRRVR